MILAAADYAYGSTDAVPPPELLDYFSCNLYSSLPNGKGWKNEPYKWLRRVNTFVNVYNSIKEHAAATKRLKGKAYKDWFNENKAVFDTITYIEDLRKNGKR